MYKKLFLTGIIAMLPAAIIPVQAHDDLDHQFRDQKHEVHDAANAGLISPQQHQMLDMQRNAQHAALDNGYQANSGYSGAGGYPVNGVYSSSGYPLNGVNGGYAGGGGNAYSLPGYAGNGHINDPAINPGHNNSIGHRIGDALNGNTSINQGMYAAPYGAAPYGYGNQNYATGYTTNGHELLRQERHQVHDMANQGLISPLQHQQLDQQRHNQHDSMDGKHRRSWF
ncbi:MAG TPA: hypothetical protein V6C86_12855 [Oculatellaceae cyanobacterium]